MPRLTLQQCLIESDPGRLEAIARHWGVGYLPGRRREAASLLAQHMVAPGALERIWAALSPEEQAALAALHTADGTMPWPTFSRRWGQVRDMGAARMARDRPWERPVSPAEGLWYRGLVFRTFVDGPSGLYEVALLPEELRACLPASPSPSPLLLAPVTPPPAVLAEGDRLLDDACTLLAYLQSHPVRPGPTGDWPARSQSEVARQLHEADLERLAFLRHLAERLGWVRPDRAGYLRPVPGPVSAWLQASAGEQRLALARAWRDDPSWNDLWHVPILCPEDTGSWHNDPLLARKAVLRHLTACQPGTWYGLEDFTAAIHERDPDFQRPDGDYSTWYIRDANTGEYLSGFASWEAVEGALIRYLLTGPMAWLGMVDLGGVRLIPVHPAVQPLSQGEREARGKKTAPDRRNLVPTVFRVSPAGAAFLGRGEPEPAPQDVPLLSVRRDLSILVPSSRRYERFQLSRVADWVRTGDPYVYRLTPASLERARRQGIEPARVQQFLERVSGGRVPRTLPAVLDRWLRQGAEARLEPAVILRAQDERLLQELAAAPATRRFLREVLGPTVALVARSDWPRLVEALVEHGLLPDLSGLGEGDEG